MREPDVCKEECPPSLIVNPINSHTRKEKVEKGPALRSLPLKEQANSDKKGRK